MKEEGFSKKKKKKKVEKETTGKQYGSSWGAVAQ